MPTYPTCAVLCRVNGQDGNPEPGATVVARLNQYEVYNGYVIPERTQAVTDENGECILELWPNQLGATESMYNILISSTDNTRETMTAVVPNTSTANLHEIATLPAYPGKSDGELILDAAVAAAAPAAASASEAAASALAAGTSEINAAVSETNAATSEAAAAVSEANAGVSATAAQTAQTAAETAASSVAAAGAEAAAAAVSATEADASATAASTSETNADGSAQLAADWAEKADGFDVDGVGTRSAKHHAGQAETNATAAEVSATNAANSAASTESAETNSAASAAAATISETNAGNSEINAAASESAASTSETNATASASAASTSASAASTSADAASTSASNAATSETNAGTSETNAGTSASNASTSETNAASSASAASTSETNAAASETGVAADAAAAAASETAAAASESAASTSETNAAASASTASTGATTATTQAGLAAAAKTAAELAEANAAADAAQTASDLAAVATIFDNFDDRYLGPKASDPTLDNDGNALIVGAVYWNSVSNETRFWNGAIWESSEAAAAASAQAASDAQIAAEAAQTAAEAAETGVAANASAATTAASNAATSETNASGSATAASDSASSASTDATTATTQAGIATTQAGLADTARVAAQAAQTAAESAETGTIAARDDFFSRYLGVYANDTAANASGYTISEGLFYWNSTDDSLRIYTGTVWSTAVLEAGDALVPANNLSDLINAATARTNLGLGSAAPLNVAAAGNAAAGEVVKGDDSRLSDARTPVAHNHAIADVTGLQAALDNAGSVDTVNGQSGAVVLDPDDLDDTSSLHKFVAAADITNWNTAFGWGDHSGVGYLTSVAWGDVTGKPVTFTPSAHNHTLSEITDSGTVASLDVAAVGDAAVGEVVKGNDSRLTDARTPTAHSQAISTITGLQAELDGKVDDAQVLTNVPAGAVFTDTTYSVGNGGLTEVNFTTTLDTELTETSDRLNETISGMALEKPDISIVNDAGTLYWEVEAIGGGNVRFLINGNITTLDCTTGAGTGGKARVALTAGVDANTPAENYVYVTDTAGVASLNSSGILPTGAFGWIGKALVPDAVTFNTTGAYVIQRYTESLLNSERGALSHQREKLRAVGAVYIDGVSTTTSITPGAPDSVHAVTASGTVYQLHRQPFPAFTTGPYHIGNGDTNTFARVTDLNEILQTADGTAISNNKRYNLVLWGAVNLDSGDCKLFVNQPTGTYASDEAAMADVNGYADYTVPLEARSVAFMVARISLKYSTAGGGTFTELGTYSLLGTPVGVRSSGTSVSPPNSISNFPDNTFSVFDSIDTSKSMTLAVGGVTTGNTRTLTVPDTSGTIALESYVDGAISGLVDTAPGTLDTLNELAAALGDDPNFATTMTNALAGKATTAQGSNADTAYGWGNHASAGYITGYTVTQGDVTAHQAALSITESQISDLSHFTPTSLLVDYSFTDNSTNWNTAFGWGDHSIVGYKTSVSEGDVTAHQSALSITESQISDLGSYLTTVAWVDVTGKPTTFTPAAHTHAISEVTSLQTTLDAKAPLASPALTGSPTAPTQAADDNSTKIATTAYVDAAAAGAGGGLTDESVAHSSGTISADVTKDFTRSATDVATPVTISVKQQSQRRGEAVSATHNINLGSPAVGDMILLFVGGDADDPDAAVVTGDGLRGPFILREATVWGKVYWGRYGTDITGSQIQLTSVAGNDCWHITNWGPTGDPEFTDGVNGSSSSYTFNTVTGGLTNDVVVALVTLDDDNNSSANSPPSGYTALTTAYANTTGNTLYVGHKTLTGDGDETPGTWLGTSDAYASGAILLPQTSAISTKDYTIDLTDIPASGTAWRTVVCLDVDSTFQTYGTMSYSDTIVWDTGTAPDFSSGENHIEFYSNGDDVIRGRLIYTENVAAGTLIAGTSAGNVLQLDSEARIPAVDGSQITGLAGWEYIQTQEFSSVSSVTFTGLDTEGFDAYVFVLSEIEAATSGAELCGRIGNGSISTSSVYRSSLVWNDGGGQNAGAYFTDEFFIGVDNGTGTDSVGHGFLYLFHPNNSSFVTSWRSNFDVMNGSVEWVTMCDDAGFYDHSTDRLHDRIQFYMQSGNVSGKISMYGIRRS